MEKKITKEDGEKTTVPRRRVQEKSRRVEFVAVQALQTQTIKRKALTLDLQQEVNQQSKKGRTSHKADEPEEQVQPSQGTKRKNAAAFSRLVGKACRVSS